MAKPTRTKIERESDLEKLAALYLQGHKQADIAMVLAVSQQQISYDLKILQGRWKASSIRDLDAAKGEELAKIDEMERVYWQAWRDSGGLIKIKTVDRERVVFDSENKMHKGSAASSVPLHDKDGVEVGQAGEIIRSSVRTERFVGEAKFLDGLKWCVEQRCKILGINAPAKIAPTDPSGDKEYGIDGLTDEEAINQLATLFNAARAREAAQADESGKDTNLGTESRPADNGGQQQG